MLRRDNLQKAFTCSWGKSIPAAVRRQIKNWRMYWGQRVTLDSRVRSERGSDHEVDSIWELMWKQVRPSFRYSSASKTWNEFFTKYVLVKYIKYHKHLYVQVFSQVKLRKGASHIKMSSFCPEYHSLCYHGCTSLISCAILGCLLSSMLYRMILNYQSPW